MFQSKFKKLKKEGKGNGENAAQPISDNEISILYEKGYLGLHNPQALLNMIWLHFTINFGMRGIQEHYDLRYCIKTKFIVTVSFLVHIYVCNANNS